MKPAVRRASEPSVVSSIPNASVDSRCGRGRLLLLLAGSPCGLLLLLLQAPLLDGMSGGGESPMPLGPPQQRQPHARLPVLRLIQLNCSVV